jgi:hypothetical protein
MNIRPYQKQDQKACLEIFDSNCPTFFDPSERLLYMNWLISIEEGIPPRENMNPYYYFVSEEQGHVIAAFGFYGIENTNDVRLSWGMVHCNRHGEGIGTEVFQYRLYAIKKILPNHQLKLDTSQHTLQFYKRMGFEVLLTEKDGYGKGLDRIEMIFRP